MATRFCHLPRLFWNVALASSGFQNQLEQRTLKANKCKMVAAIFRVNRIPLGYLFSVSGQLKSFLLTDMLLLCFDLL